MFTIKIGLLSIIVSCVATLLVLSSSVSVDAFQSSHRTNPSSSINLHAEPSNNIQSARLSRRNVIQKSAGIVFSILLGETAMEESASASYSAYTRREDDWKEREKNGGEFNAAETYWLLCFQFVT